MERRPPPSGKQFFIVWFALLNSQLLFGFVLWFTIRNGQNPGLRLEPAIGIVLPALALLVWLLALAMPRFIRSPDRLKAQNPGLQDDDLKGLFRGTLISSWALGEAGTLLGFVLGRLHFDLNVFLPYLGAGLLVHTLNIPSMFRQNI